MLVYGEGSLDSKRIMTQVSGKLQNHKTQDSPLLYISFPLPDRFSFWCIINRVLRIQQSGIGDNGYRHDSEHVDFDTEDDPRQNGSEHQLQSTGKRLQNRVQRAKKQCRDDANGCIIHYDAEDFHLDNRRYAGRCDCVFQVTGYPENHDITKYRVEVHEYVLQHKGHIAALAFQQVLVVNTSKTGAEDLHNYQGQVEINIK